MSTQVQTEDKREIAAAKESDTCYALGAF